MTTEETIPEFEALLEYIKASRNFDFSGYKRSTLTRRVSKRMQSVGIGDYAEYTDYLQVHPEELSQLFTTVLINVTKFFRDPPAWHYLTTSVIPRIVAAKEADEPIRVWSIGCASGEEPYTLAMIFAEDLGFEQFRDRVKIYATDVDEEALAQARQAVYGAKELEEIPTGYRERYFEPANGSYAFRKDYRRAVIFGRHDLMQDPPISKIDLLVCRNTLIYFNAEAQRTILSRFQFALNDGGILFLGKSEMPMRNPGLAVLDIKSRIFIKPPSSPADDALAAVPGTDQGVLYDVSSRARLREAAFDSSTVAQVVLDSNHMLEVANGRARSLFGLDQRDIGRPLQWLQASYRSPELRAAITQAEAARRPITLPDLEWPSSSGELTQLDVHIVPLLDSRGGSAGLSISLVDVTRYKHLQEQLVRATREADTTSEALMSTNEELQTTNEELQSTVEELETTNEELQSTNEELETLNEELESTNEEMGTVNDELRTRNDEVKRLNDFLGSVLSGLRGGIVVMDRDRRIDVWNSTAESLWGLRADEVTGKDFLGLDLGLPIAELAQPLQECLSGAIDYQQLTLSATDRRGHAIQCKITCTPLGRKDDEIRGAILLMERLGSDPA